MPPKIKVDFFLFLSKRIYACCKKDSLAEAQLFLKDM